MKKRVNKNLSSGTNIKYTGKVTIEVESKNKKPVNKKILFNHGTVNLFEFLARCIGEQWSAARQLVPAYLGVFSIEKNKGSLVTQDDFTIATKVNLNNIYKINTGDLEPIYDTNRENVIGYVTRLHFRVPGTILSSTSAPVAYQYDALALYCYANLNDVTKMSAWLPIVGENDDIESLLPSGLSISSINDYVFNIQWELRFENN